MRQIATGRIGKSIRQNEAFLSHRSEPMKSPEVYALLKSHLAPWFKSAGFKRAKGFLSWSRPHGDGHVVVWCQISQDGWDSYAGSKFAVEFQRSTEPVVGAHPARRRRLAAFLSPEEREEVRSIQNGDWRSAAATEDSSGTARFTKGCGRVPFAVQASPRCLSRTS